MTTPAGDGGDEARLAGASGKMAAAGRLCSSLTAGAYAQAANLLLHLLSIPVLPSAWGAGIWGEWLLLARYQPRPMRRCRAWARVPAST
jgi:hypothetical protein